MRIYLTQLINEVLGVPNGVIELSQSIPDSISDQINDNEGLLNSTVTDTPKVTFKIKGPIDIGDETWSNIKITIVIEKRKFAGFNRYKSASLNLNFGLDTDASLKNIKVDEKDTIALTLYYEFGSDSTWGDVDEYLTTDGNNQLREVLAHELMHAFNFRKNPKVKATDLSKYATSDRYTKSEALKEFNENLYYVHFIENLVRPAEFAAYLKNNLVDKKEFSDFLKENSMYKKLVAIKNYTFDELKDKLKKETNNKNYLVAQKLNSNYQSLTRRKEKYYKTYLKNISNDQIKTAEKEASDKVLADISRFGDNYEAFYKYEIKQMNKAADKTLRKLAKLYAYIS